MVIYTCGLCDVQQRGCSEGCWTEGEHHVMGGCVTRGSVNTDKRKPKL